MAVHRYWRLLFQQAQPGNNWRFVEIALKATPGGANFATVAANCSSSSNYSGAYLPANAIDGNLSTSWVAGSQSVGTEFWEYDNGSTTDLQEITITADTYLPGTPLYANVQGSDNNSTWVTEWTFIAPLQWTTGNQIQTFTRNTPRTGGHRYWSILWLTNQSAGGNGGASNVILRTVSGGTNICQAPGGTPLSDSNWSGSNIAWDAFDPDPTFATAWVSGATPPTSWVGFDFGAGEAPLVIEVVITARNDTSFAQGPINGTVRWSDDGSTWNVAWTFTAAFWTQGSTQTFDATPASVPPMAWNPSDKNAGISLTGSNLVATSSAGSNGPNQAVRATPPLAVAKQYFEVTVTGTLGQYYSVGVMNNNAPLGQDVGYSNGASFIDKFSSGNSELRVNAAMSGTYPALAGGQIVRVAVDRNANRMWFAINNNTWSGSAVWMGSGATTDNPATGSGGLNIGPVTGALYAAFSSTWTGDVATVNGGAGGFAYAVPAGFAGVDPAPVIGGGATQAMALILA